ncbi:ribosome-inactivating protein [Xylaria bambusicola]|uniref:ribosome-inactivating protein n=1 Tax=Xylaria bambusicola TaxID=326684 RepID=UPI002007F9CB|nr:ribosome-inactivating protein [Xylaria bambusicola]KAI0513267.1 ribosome-inactivating protein [Xylaria bambusicola]
MNPDFELTFDIDDGEAEYNRLIVEIRDRLSEGRRSACQSVRYLRPQQDPPANWFDVVLTAGQQTIRVRFRSDNLYLDAYQQGNTPTSQWFEFSDAPRITPGATRLTYQGGYPQLEPVAETGSSGRATMALGRAQLENAIQVLGRGPAQESQRARQLLVLIQMISEAVRFTWISDEFVNNWWGTVQPEGRMMGLQNAWRILSGGVLHANEGDADTPLRMRENADNTLNINTPRAAAAVLGIMVCRALPGPNRPGRSTMTTMGQNPFDYPKGRELVEVFWLCINDIDGEDDGSLYGTVIAVDALGSQYVYNRDRSKPESIAPGQHALLTGPPQSIEAADSFAFVVDLMDYDYLSPDDSIAKGTINWNPYNIANQYDKALTDSIKGDNGLVTLHYVVLSNASQALIEIILINGDGESTASVYGTITAYNEHGDSQLFLKPDNDSYVNVSPNTPIPLLRSVVAVPMTGALTIDALLYDYDEFSPDDEIAKGKAVFRPDIGKSEAQSIKGAYGEISVRVTWS